jgi:hypothetical protein
LALYVKDAVIESPSHHSPAPQKKRACAGDMRNAPFFQEVATRKPVLRRYYRPGYFTDGKRVIWAYPRVTPDEEQMDFVESMELNDSGLIQYHKVYWGWRSCKVLQNNEYHH